MAKPPRGTRGLDEARFRRENPGEHQRRGATNSHWERAVRAWEGALTLAEELDVTPHEALLRGVRIAAARVTDVELRRAEVLREHDGRVEDPEVMRLTRESRMERVLMFKASKAAVDAGIAERLVRTIEMESRIIVTVTGRTVDRLMTALDLPNAADWRVWVHEVVHRELLAIEGPQDAEPGALRSTEVDVPAPPASIRREPPAQPAPDGPRSTSAPRSDDDAGTTTRINEADSKAPSPPPDPDPDVDTIPPRSRPRFVPSRNQPIDRPKTFVRVTENPDGSTTTSGGYRDGD
jgi:hypothetical protein